MKILTEATLEDDEGNKISLAQTDTEAVRVFKRVGYALTLPEGISVLQAGPSS